VDAKLLTESAWKGIVAKSKVKDNGLQRALAAYEKLDEQEHEARLKAIGTVSQLVPALKRAKDVAASEQVVDYLTDLAAVAEAARREIAQAKIVAEKAAAAAAKTEEAAGKKAEAEAKQQQEEEEEANEEDDDEEDENEDSTKKLLTALRILKTAKKPFYFLACDKKPYGLIISKKDIRKNALAKKELAKIAGGTKRQPKLGECSWANNTLVLDMLKPPSGLARFLKKWIKDTTGLTMKVMVGTQTDDEEEEGGAQQDSEQPADDAKDQQPDKAQTPQQQEAKPVGAAAPARPNGGKLEKAPEEWRQTRNLIGAKIDQLKRAVREAFADEDGDILAELDQGMKQLDGILQKLSQELADSIAKANEDKNPSTRASELARAKSILVSYIKYVKTEPMIAQMDSNPFGVQTNLKQTLVSKLTYMAQAIS
jgi:hypothetical protein